MRLPSFLALFLAGGCLTIHAIAAAPAVPDTMAQRTLACTACHGENGKAGPDGYYPRLAGKPAGYLYHQLRNFRDGKRHYAPMTGLLDTLSDDYLKDIAAYFSAQSHPYPPPSQAAGDPAQNERARTLVQQGDKNLGVPACKQCHGAALMGVQPATPALLGLPGDYINGQLGGWRSGQRQATTPDCMARIASRLSLSDISALSRWLASQPVPVPSSPAAQRPEPGPDHLAMECGSTP